MEEDRCSSVRLVLAAFEVAMALPRTLREGVSLTQLSCGFLLLLGCFFPFFLFI